MIFFEILVIIFFLLSLFIFILSLTKIEVEIKKFKYNNKNIKEKLIKDYLIYIRFKIFDKITWLKIKIDDKRIKKINKKFNKRVFNNLKRLILNNRYKILNKNIFKDRRKINIEFKSLDLQVKVGALESIVTAILVSTISTVLSIFLALELTEFNSKKCRYIIEPIYTENIQLIIELNCIISIKMANIINIVYILFNKKRSVNYDERTSDRRTYVCSND